MEKELRLQKGITLIALVVTIVVLLILAGITISLVFSDNGIIAKAREASSSYTNAANEEQKLLNDVDKLIEGIAPIKKKEELELEDESKNEALQPFITKWKTTTDNESIKLPLMSDGEYDFTVNYGDGSEYQITTYDDTNATHTYATAGTYTVTIKGKMTDFAFGDVPESKDKIVELVQWGNTQLVDIDFEECTNLAGSIPVPVKGTLVQLNSVANLFRGCTSLTGEIPENLFYNAPNLQYLSSVFKGCTGLIGTIPETLFVDLDEANEISGAFSGCTGLTGEIPANLFANNTELEYLRSVFSGCTGLTGEIPRNLFANNTDVIDMGNMFSGCTELTGSIPANLFANNTELIDVGAMFYECTGLTGSIPENLFANNTKIEDMDEVFKRCTGLTGSIPEKLFANNREVITFESIFEGCTGLTGNIPANLFANHPNVTSYKSVFESCSGLTGEIPANLFATSPLVQNFRKAFYYCEGLTMIYSNMFDNNNSVTDFSSAFEECINLQGTAPSLWERTGVNGERCYNDCAGLDNYNDAIANGWE